MKELGMALTYEEFERHLEAIASIMRLQDGFYELLNEYNSKSLNCCDFIFPTLIDNVVDLLVLAMHDESGWISYWVFDLDCGNEYRDGCAEDDEGNLIKLKTIEDLWRILTTK